MADTKSIRVLLVEDNADFAQLLQTQMKKSREPAFEVVWVKSGREALAELQRENRFDLIVMDYFLPGQNGLEVAKEIRASGRRMPVVFLTVNRDFDLAVEVMKAGVDDYLVKDEVATPALLQALAVVVERRTRREQGAALEVSRERLSAIQELVAEVAREIQEPITRMGRAAAALEEENQIERLQMYLTIIRDNLKRLEEKLERLKTVDAEKTVTYVRDIKMLDLS
jgi:CheY-like chemotaxis protein